ncbi:hypothetical protein GCM10010298_71270 [Streptomyces microflavus]|uniref:Uncharacterized protein n=1 Tax=Streptomyces microflavus TaxID=1919 RepID=A0A7J0CM90_STRMI|nr:hypothetical protein Smic_15900 [Streptomyces microflavus]GGX95679.1 hypothetical protein GCM10010298_71270 [Streptomyces microflavus]
MASTRATVRTRPMRYGGGCGAEVRFAVMAPTLPRNPAPHVLLADDPSPPRGGEEALRG